MPEHEEESFQAQGQGWFARIDHSAFLHGIVLLMAIGGGLLTGYTTFQHQSSDLSALQQRVTFDEATITRLEAGMTAASTETRQSLSRVLDQLGALQVLVERANNRIAPDAPRR